MEPWELESEISRNELPEFSDILKRELFTTKFCAVMAKKIIMAANQNDLTTAEITRGITIWLDKLKKAGISPTNQFNEGETNNETD